MMNFEVKVKNKIVTEILRLGNKFKFNRRCC